MYVQNQKVKTAETAEIGNFVRQTRNRVLGCYSAHKLAMVSNSMAGHAPLSEGRTSRYLLTRRERWMLRHFASKSQSCLSNHMMGDSCPMKLDSPRKTHVCLNQPAFFPQHCPGVPTSSPATTWLQISVRHVSTSNTANTIPGRVSMMASTSNLSPGTGFSNVRRV